MKISSGWMWLVPVLALGSAAAAGAQVVDCTPHSYPQRTDQSLAVDPFDDRIVYVGVEGEGYFKTVNDGASWTRIVTGVRSFDKRGGGQCYSEFFDTVVDPRNPEHVCFAMAGSPGTLEMMQSANQGVYCSDDGGARWEQRVGPTMNTAIAVARRRGQCHAADGTLVAARNHAVRSDRSHRPANRGTVAIGHAGCGKP